MITSVKEMITKYVDAWNETSLEAYTTEFAKCYVPDAIYTDPYGEYKGLNALANFAYVSLAIVPTRKFEVLETPEYHHNSGKYMWQVTSEGGSNTGYDYFEFNADFKITRLVSFFKLPEDYPLDKLS